MQRVSSFANLKRFNAFAYTSPGLEKYLAKELGGICGKNINISGSGGCDINSISEYDLWKICYSSRLISGIRIRIGSPKEISKFNVFERYISTLPWEYFLPLKNSFNNNNNNDNNIHIQYKFNTTCSGSKLYHSDAISQRLREYLEKKKLIPISPKENNINTNITSSKYNTEHDNFNKNRELYDIACKYPHMLDVCDTDQNIYDKPSIPMNIHIRLVDNISQASIDVGGNLLSRRGYKIASVEAPIRENYAASCFDIINYNGESIWDPFCGSGTFICEGLLKYVSLNHKQGLALNQLTKKKRDYIFKYWNCFPKEQFNEWNDSYVDHSCNIFNNTIKDNKCLYIASDISKQAINASKKNWKELTNSIRDDNIHFFTGDFENVSKQVFPLFTNKSKPIIISNIPYGCRIQKQLNTLYNRFNRFVKDNSDQFLDVYIIDGSENNHFLSIASSNNVSWTSLAQFSNGGIGVKLLKLTK